MVVDNTIHGFLLVVSDGQFISVLALSSSTLSSSFFHTSEGGEFSVVWRVREIRTYEGAGFSS